VRDTIPVRYLIWLLSRDFVGIFAELLPGNFAKLQPPDNQDLMDGLEIKVQLGSVWKQSLTELSGGQQYAQFVIIALTTVSYLRPTRMFKGRLSRYL
jgi:chromosome segregation ATPase